MTCCLIIRIYICDVIIYTTDFDKKQCLSHWCYYYRSVRWCVVSPGCCSCRRPPGGAASRSMCLLPRLRGSEMVGGSRVRSATDPQPVHISQEAPTRRLPPTFLSSSGNKTSGAAAALASLSGTHPHIYISQEVLFSQDVSLQTYRSQDISYLQ